MAKDRGSKLSTTFIDTFAKMIDGLENGKPVRDMDLTNEEVRGRPSIQCRRAERSRRGPASRQVWMVRVARVRCGW